MRIRPKQLLNILLSFASLSATLLPLNGCVTKSKADAQAHLAFLAGQQQALMRLQQQQQFRGPSVTFIGPVQNYIVAWQAGLQLTQAILSASYSGNSDPSAIVIHRNGEGITVDPKKLLAGEDFPLLAGDVIELQP